MSISLSDWTSTTGDTWGSRDAYIDYPVRGWDSVVWISEQGAVTLPGVATVSVESSINVDIRVTAKADGASMIYQGTPPRDVSISFQCWMPRHMEEWVAILPKLIMSSQTIRSMKGVKPSTPGAVVPLPSFQFSHPVLAANGLRHLVIMKTVGPKVEPAGGGFSVEITAKEWMKMKPRETLQAAGSSADPAIYGPGTPPIQDAVTPPSTRIAKGGPR